MQIGIVGLGRMGANIARRLMQHGHAAVAYDRDVKAEQRSCGIRRARRARVQAGQATRGVGDVAGGRKHGRRDQSAWRAARARRHRHRWRQLVLEDDIRRAAALKERGLHYVDVGTSGGVWGLERGYCMMIGGEKSVVDRLDPIFAALAAGLGNVPRTPGRYGRAGSEGPQEADQLLARDGRRWRPIV